eukprot:CAMPEP_0201548354 /NCGR_PEP_ID=MMETSP0173_2-20130828/4883_1 /ASSEMBLY_ACC=CAM_ASM_000268 /TAXON_ID=218659 /ORGANISM="Vexillifera sp., Strain DIVA3 564/2" /LENGTH=388 /DNA_ID=CAMNT_0047957705 /DNA_START=30 /DNA_END=1193 /DNA_ORIENTATION=+
MNSLETTLSSLPYEIQMNICSHLKCEQSLCSLSCTSRHFQHLANEDCHWRDLIEMQDGCPFNVEQLKIWSNASEANTSSTCVDESRLKHCFQWFHQTRQHWSHGKPFRRSKTLRCVQDEYRETLSCVSTNALGTRAVVGSWDTNGYLYEIEPISRSTSRVLTLGGSPRGRVDCAHFFSKDQVVLGDTSGSLRFYQVTDDHSNNAVIEPNQRWDDHGWVKTMCSTKSHPHLYYAIENNIRVLDIAEHTLSDSISQAHDHYTVMTMDVWHDVVVSGGLDNKVRLFDFRLAQDQRQVGAFLPSKDHRGGVRQVSYLDANTIVCSGGRPKRLYFWDIRALSSATTVLKTPDMVEDVCVSPDSTKLVVATRSKGTFLINLNEKKIIEKKIIEK